MAGNGPRSVRYSARVGDGWVTTGPKVDELEAWWSALATARDTLEQELDRHGRDATSFPRYLNLDASPQFALASLDTWQEMSGRAGELGFTDVVTHWPRADGPYAGRESVLEQVAATFD